MTKPTFKREQALSLSSYSIKNKKEGEAFYIRVDSEMTTKEMLKADGTPDTDENGKVKHLTHCMVTDLVTGEQGEMVCPFLVKKAFDVIVERDKKLSGHTFELTKGKKKNRTNEWDVYEVSVS